MSQLLDFHVIGSGDAFGSGGKLFTSFLLSASSEKTTKHILIDCGASTIIGLKRAKIEIAAIELVVITHFHGDHFGGLAWLLLEHKVISKRSTPLVIVSPKGGKEKIRQLLDVLYEGTGDLVEDKAFVFHDFEEAAVQIGQGKEAIVVEAIPVKHSAASRPHAVSVETHGKKVVYTGDTEWVDSLPAFASGADLFISECFHLSGTKPAHLSHETLVQKRSLFDVKRFYITHLGPELVDNADTLAFDVLNDEQGFSL